MVEEHGDVVDEVVEQLIECAGRETGSSFGQLSRQPSGQPQEGLRTHSVDMIIKAEAADPPWICSKRAYFHPRARPSEYIRDILRDPYFNHRENWNPPDRLTAMPTLRGRR